MRSKCLSLVRQSGFQRLCATLYFLLLLAGCSNGLLGSKSYTVPDEHVSGQEKFVAMCSVCHGSWADGTEIGPPLIDIVYEPAHHSDRLFFSAVENGVTRHHWDFGNMPPVPQASREDAGEMIAFIRWLQRENGIGEDY